MVQCLTLEEKKVLGLGPSHERLNNENNKTTVLNKKIKILFKRVYINLSMKQPRNHTTECLKEHFIYTYK